MTRQMKLAAISLACAALFISYGVNAEPAESGKGLRVRGPIRSIELPELQYDLPTGPGREITQLYCATCHTTRYIMIQPMLSRATWTVEMTKMRKAFSAPIPEEKVGEIMEYLMLVRGVEDKPGAK